VAFANAGHALVLVRRLNAQFKTDRFSAGGSTHYSVDVMRVTLRQRRWL
jgi:hypothetical protein